MDQASSEKLSAEETIMNEINKCPTVYITFLVVSVVIACVASFYGRIHFQKCCVVYLICQGIIFFLKPEYVLPRSTESVTLDDLHVFLSREMCMVSFLFAYLLWTSLHLSDATPRISFMFAWTVSHIMKCVTRFYHRQNRSHSDGFATFGEEERIELYSFLTEFVWLFLLFCHVITTLPWCGQATSDYQVNFHLRVDNMITAFVGLSIFGFPDWMIKSMATLDVFEPSHKYMSNIYGINLIAMSMVAGRAINFIRSEDKANYMRAHLIFLVLASCSVIYSRMTSSIINTSFYLVILSRTIPQIVNLAAAYATIKVPNFPAYFPKLAEKSN